MNITLYKATELARLESHIDFKTGEVDIEAFEDARITVGHKQQAYIAVLKNGAATIDLLDGAVKDLQAKKKALERQQGRLREALYVSMRATGCSVVRANDATFEARLYIDRDKSVQIEDGAVFDAVLCNPPKPLEPSKKLIEAAIMRGEAITGAKIVRKDRLEIK
jgi:Siphovirus Gp157